MFKQKYKKYKTKYLSSRNLKGGNNDLILNEKEYHPKDLVNLDFKYIVGPVSFDILANQNKTIYAFGDYHVYSQNIEMTDKIYLPDYLEQLFLQNPDSQFDLFIELPYSVDKKVGEMAYGLIENTNQKFDICFQDLTNKSECSKKYKNVRFHAIDLRYSYKINSDHDIKINKYTIYHHKSTKFIQENKLIDQELMQLKNGTISDTNELKNKFKKLYDEVISHKEKIYSKNGFKDYYNEILGDVEKIEKYSQTEFSVVIERYLDDAVDNFYEKYLNWINSQNDLINNKMLYTQIFDLYLEKNDFESAEKIFKILTDAIINFDYHVSTIGQTLIDIYCLLRMMRCDNYENPCKNLIILAGRAHIRNFINFFTKYYNYQFAVNKLCKPLELFEQIYKLKGIDLYAESEKSGEEILFIYKSPDLRYVEVNNDEIVKYLSK